MGVKRVLIPGMLTHPDGDGILAEAPDVEVIYAQSSEERALGYTVPAREAIRREALAEALDRWLPEIHALHCLGVGGHLPVTAEMIERAARLEVLFIAASGTDKIDVKAATGHGVLVLNAPGANAPAVAEHTLGLMLGLARRICSSDRVAHRERRSARNWLATTPPPLSLLSGRTLGLIGFGFIGREVARLCHDALRMKVLAYDPVFDSLEAERLGVDTVDSVNELISRSDVVSLHAPLMPETVQLIGRSELERFKPSAYLLNTARGGLVDTDALVEALAQGTIAGAALDVTDPEPLPEGHPLFDLENVILTPHSAGNSPEVLSRMAVTACRQLLQALRGGRPHHIVNPAAWELHVERLGLDGSRALAGPTAATKGGP